MNMNSLVDFKKKKKKTDLAEGDCQGSDIWIGKVISFLFFGSVLLLLWVGWGIGRYVLLKWMNGTGIVITNESEIGGEIRSGAAQGRCAVSLVNTQYIVKSSFILYMKKSERQSQIAYFQIPILFYQRFPCITLFHTL